MFKKVTEIIELIEKYHEGLSDYFLLLKSKTEDQRVHLLLDYLGEE